jgi:hypothetical protein
MVLLVCCSYLKEEWRYMNQEVPTDFPIPDRIWKHLDRRIEDKIIAVSLYRKCPKRCVVSWSFPLNGIYALIWPWVFLKTFAHLYSPPNLHNGGGNVNWIFLFLWILMREPQDLWLLIQLVRNQITCGIEFNSTCNLNSIDNLLQFLCLE